MASMLIYSRTRQECEAPRSPWIGFFIFLSACVCIGIAIYHLGSLIYLMFKGAYHIGGVTFLEVPIIAFFEFLFILPFVIGGFYALKVVFKHCLN